MIKNLLIKNYALIELLELEFESGLNVLTGETGAGKSIIIDALSLLLGDRASTEIIRSGADKAVIEGIFEIGKNKKIQKLLSNNQLETNEELIVRREISIKGQSRSFINDTPVSLTHLKTAGEMLVDLHGQHEHQSLLYPETHIQMLDDYAGLDGLLFEYQKSYRLLASLFAELDSLRGRERELHEKRDLYMFQIQEIDELSPQSGEEHTLNAEALILENAEKLFQSTQQVHQILYEGEHSVYDLVVQVRNQLEDLCHIDPSFAEAKNEAVSTVAIIGELAKFIQSYNSRIEFNAERLEEIRERLGRLTLLKKKYGGSIDSTIDYRQRIGKEFSLAENYEEEIRRLEAKIEDERKRCSETAQRLSSKRREYATKIESFIIDELFKLGIKNAQFNVKIENHRILNKEHKHFFVTLGNDIFESNDLGFDYVEFYISTNLGEDVRPLVKVASGGEVSRVMLALKTILAKSERLPAMVFDEIDVGISGRIAQSVGRSLKNLSRFHQIIAITHLPQIAGLADTHFAVEKVEQKKRSVTRIRKLDENERIREVAKLMSGEEITEAGLEGAKELMGL